jgi:hypothetical protein
MAKVMARANGLDVHKVPDGYIIYQNEHDNVCYLNKTAAIVFEFCDGNLDSDEIIARVAKIFGLKNSSDSEIRECLDSLVKEGLVRFNSK